MRCLGVADICATLCGDPGGDDAVGVGGVGVRVEEAPLVAAAAAAAGACSLSTPFLPPTSPNLVTAPCPSTTAR